MLVPLRHLAFLAPLLIVTGFRGGSRTVTSDQTTPNPTSEGTLPGHGLVQHPFLYCGEWQQRGKSEQVMYLVRDGKVVWTYAVPGKEEYGVAIH